MLEMFVIVQVLRDALFKPQYFSAIFATLKNSPFGASGKVWGKIG